MLCNDSIAKHSRCQEGSFERTRRILNDIEAIAGRDIKITLNTPGRAEVEGRYVRNSKTKGLRIKVSKEDSERFNGKMKPYIFHQTILSIYNPENGETAS